MSDRLSELIALRQLEARDRFGAKWRRESAWHWGVMAIVVWITSLASIGFALVLRDVAFSLCAFIFAAFLYLNGRTAWRERVRLLREADALYAVSER